jgi:hypothetical protein
MGERHTQSYVHDGRRLDGLNEIQWQNSFLCLLFIYLLIISRRRKLIILSDEINQSSKKYLNKYGHFGNQTGIVVACSTNSPPTQLSQPDPHNQTLTTSTHQHAQPWVVLWSRGWMCDVRHISTVPYFFILRFSIPMSPQYIARVFFVPYAEKPPQTI